APRVTRSSAASVLRRAAEGLPQVMRAEKNQTRRLNRGTAWPAAPRPKACQWQVQRSRYRIEDPRRGGTGSMITVPHLAGEALGTLLATHMTRRFGSTHGRLTELIPTAARLALDCIGNSDALYHNVEHTMLVTLAGHDIMKGR